MTRRLSDKEGQDSSDKNTKNGNKANGVVYTPQEVIDFMVAETSRLLRENFGEDFGSEEVQVEDPFTGDGRYPEAILRFTAENGKNGGVEACYANMWANELDPNVAGIAKANLEEAYTELTGEEKEADVTNMDTFKIDPESNPPREWTDEEQARHLKEIAEEEKAKKRATAKAKRAQKKMDKSKPLL